MRKFISLFCDVLAIVVGVMAFLVLFITPENSEDLDILTKCAAVICQVCYIAPALILYIFSRPKFDWHLLHGNLLRKILCVVLLMPFLLTDIVDSKPISSIPVESPQELTCDEALYHKVDSSALKAKQVNPPLLWTVYYQFIDPGNQHMTSTKSGRAWAALIAILGVFLLNGLLVSTIIGYVDSRKERWLRGGIDYKWFLRLKLIPHYIIIGGNDMVASIVGQILKNPNRIKLTKYPMVASIVNKILNNIDLLFPIFGPYVFIQTSRDVESFRRELFSTLTEKQQRRVIIYYGNRNSFEDIKKLSLHTAKEVYILGEETRTDDNESYHDTMNMECLGLVCEYMEKYNNKLLKLQRKNKLKCRVMFEYQTTFSVFQFYDLNKKNAAVVDFKPFNYYEMWAQKVLINKEVDSEKLKLAALKGEYLPLEGCEGIKKDDDSYVHLFVVGMSRMGVAMAIEAAHLSHYPNYVTRNKRTKITFIDKNVATEKDFFMGRFSELFALSHWRYCEVGKSGALRCKKTYAPSGFDHLGGDFIDVEWEFINGGIEQSAVQDYILASANPSARITIAICLPESNRSHAAALYLHKKIYESDSLLQVLVYNRYGSSIVNALRTTDAEKPSIEDVKRPYKNKLKAFGSPEDCFDEETLTSSEKIGDEINGMYLKIKDDFITPAKENAGQLDTKPGGYKGKSKVAEFWSNIYNGNTMWTKLRSVGYKGTVLYPDQISLLSDVEHNRWNIEQLLMHFRPLTKEEQDDVINKIDGKDKETMKGKMAHLNICSNKRLEELKDVDVAARAYDEGLTTFLHEIYSNMNKSR
jgi:hypothetical protein